VGPGRFVNACVIKVILIGEHVRLSIRELFCEMSSTTSVGIPKVDSSNCSPTIGKGYTNLLSPPTITLRLSPLWHSFPSLQNCSRVDIASLEVYSYSKSHCPQTSDSGQRNLLKPALENQSLAVSGMAGFLGKGIRSCSRLCH
jgi:hypothetical protein